MEFDDDHEEDQKDEMSGGMPVSASYESVLGNSSKQKMGITGVGGEMPAAAPVVRKGGSSWRYRECLKNHAVGIGGLAVDGCGEFMPAGEEGTLDALKCAACNCHRNFHRKESIELADSSTFHPLHHHHQHHPPHHHHQHHQQFTQYFRSPTGYLQVAPHHRPLALPSSSGGGGHSRDEQDDDVSNPSGGTGGGSGGGGGGSSSKKRFRTKFTQEQKDKMIVFAERLGWRIQKHDEEIVQQFCNETGVRRQVLKVWMHNNKHTLGKKP
uniref:Zinc finger-homeodomain protein 1 n=1 Tax=Eschscholzia californica TaxID=3467 RepID=B0LK09_ESCCA|nr:zinc finger-homeodomain protein 1 [Eschscholzia californica]